MGATRLRATQATYTQEALGAARGVVGIGELAEHRSDDDYERERGLDAVACGAAGGEDGGENGCSEHDRIHSKWQARADPRNDDGDPLGDD